MVSGVSYVTDLSIFFSSSSDHALSLDSQKLDLCSFSCGNMTPFFGIWNLGADYLRSSLTLLLLSYLLLHNGGGWSQFSLGSLLFSVYPTNVLLFYCVCISFFTSFFDFLSLLTFLSLGATLSFCNSQGHRFACLLSFMSFLLSVGVSCTASCLIPLAKFMASSTS